MIKNTFDTRILMLVLTSVFFAGIVSCSNSYMDKIEMGENTSSKLGHPNISIVSTSFIDEQGETHIMILTEIIINSLVFKNNNGTLENRSQLEIEVTDVDDSRAFQAKRSYPITVVRKSNTSIFNYDVYKVEKQINVDPGEYEINILVTDLNSGKESSITSKIVVPNPNENISHLTNIRSYGKTDEDSAFTSLNSYDISNKYDSLKFIFQVTNTESTEPLVLESRLLQFETDTTLPRGLSDRNYRDSSLEYQGIDYKDYKVIQNNRRVLNETGSVIIEFVYTNLSKGNYRFEATTQTELSGELYRARDFSIKSENYPAVRTSKELARPLAYLMTKKEYNNLLAIKDSDLLKRTIDQYWLKNINNTSKAKQILELYYNRVEKANLQFSNFKEGWKTDPGMIYILFGPPNYVDYGFGFMIWYYNFDSGNRNPSIYFEDVQYGNTLYPFEHYLLNRSASLHSLQYKQIQAWNDGSILFLNQ